jgi:hypothetical protein
MGKSNKNLFKDKKTQKIIDDFSNAFQNYVKMQKKNVYNKFLFDMQQNNTL